MTRVLLRGAPGSLSNGRLPQNPLLRHLPIVAPVVLCALLGVGAVTFHAWRIAGYAAVAMVVEDIIGVLLTQAQARDRAVLAGVLDSLAWLAEIYTTAWSLNAIDGHVLSLKVVVVLAVTAANFVGSWSGTKIGQQYITTPAPKYHVELAHQVAGHEERLRALEGGAR